MQFNKITKIYLLSIGIVLLFSVLDVKNITPFHILDSQAAWELYNKFSAPAMFFSWLAVFAILGILWYIAKRDKSEAWAVFLTPTIMVYFGLEDIIFHLVAQVPMAECMSWLNQNPILLGISRVLGESCISPKSLVISAGVGLILAYQVLKRMFRI